jgi:pyruvate-ferredoxin/flavodoxin oxidoreductase
MTKSTLNVHAGHDDYHAIDDTGFFQLFANQAQHVADLNIIAHRIAELALTPGIVAQDGFLTTHLIESMLLPERELIKEYLGRPMISSIRLHRHNELFTVIPAAAFLNFGMSTIR